MDHVGLYARLAMSSAAAAPPPSLRLAAVSNEAAGGLRHRAVYISVASSLDKNEAAPQDVLEYVARVAGLAAHRACHFPGMTNEAQDDV